MPGRVQNSSGSGSTFEQTSGLDILAKFGFGFELSGLSGFTGLKITSKITFSSKISNFFVPLT